jgi:hypothetical protein
MFELRVMEGIGFIGKLFELLTGPGLQHQSGSGVKSTRPTWPKSPARQRVPERVRSDRDATLQLHQQYYSNPDLRHCTLILCGSDTPKEIFSPSTARSSLCPATPHLHSFITDERESSACVRPRSWPHPRAASHREELSK